MTLRKVVVTMSKYTTEVRFICEQYAGLTESVGYSDMDNAVTLAMPKIFDFDFPIFDEAYRPILERKIINHYYTREIGYETVSRWKLALRNKLNEIMPKYNKLYESELLEFNPLYTHDMYTKRDNTTNTNGTSNDMTNRDFTIDDTGHDNPNQTTYKLHSDTPQGGLQGVDSETYLSDADKTTVSGSNTNSNHHTELGNITNNGSTTGQKTDDYLEHVYGYAGYNPSKLIKEYRETFLNIDEMVIKDLNKLFMGVW